jgi:hypothetical protein
MLTTRPAGRGFVAVGCLALFATLVLGVLSVAGVPPLVAAVLLAVAAVALVTSVVGSVRVGFLLADGSQGAPGLAGRALWGRAACIAAGVGPVVSVVLAAIDGVWTDRPVGSALLPAWDVCLALLAVLATVAVARSGALRGIARWSLALPAAAQAAIAVVELVPGDAPSALLTVLSGVVLPAALIVVGALFVRDAAQGPRAASDPFLRTRLGRTTGEWEVGLPASTVVAQLRVFAADQARFTLARLDETPTGAEAELSARQNWAAWGGRIHLRFDSLSEERTRVRARWNPALVTAVLTWDQGERDLHRIAAGLAAGPIPVPESLAAGAR